MCYGPKFLCLLLGHMLLTLPPQVMAQQDFGKPSVSKTDYDAALDKAVKAAKAASDEQKAATDAAKEADSAQAEVDKLKQDQQRDQEKADTDGQVKRLESEIKEAEKKLDNIDKTEQKVVNNVTNPQGQTPLTPDEDKLRQEALGGSSVPSAPQEVRDSFDATKQKLIDELKQKKQELEDAKKKAAEQTANPATTADLEKQIADREAEIKAKEAELEEARKKEQQARQAEKDASAAADQAARDFQETKKKLDQQRAIEGARRKLKDAEEQLERAKAALERKQAELNRNSDLAKIFAEIFRLLNQLSELLEELTGENADPTGALEQGAKILEEINRLLNDPNSNFQRLKDLLTDNEFQLLKDAINRLRNAQRNLQNLLREQADAAKAGETSGTRQNLRDVKSSASSNQGRATLLKSPSTELHNPIAIQKYATLERAVSSGDLEAIRQLSIVDSIDNSQGGSSAWDPVTALPGADTARDASEVVMVAAIGKHIDAAVIKMQLRAIELRDVILSAGSDPVRLAGAIQPPAENLVLDSALSAGQQLELLSDQFQTTIYRAFQGEIARALAESSAKESAVSGASVVKGNARVSSGAAMPTVTLTLIPVIAKLPRESVGDNPPEPQNQAPASDQSVAVRPDANGDFEVTIPAGLAISRLQIGGPDVSSQILRASTPTENSPPWLDPRLDDAARQAASQRFRAMDVLLESAIAGIPDHPPVAPLEAPVVRELFAQLLSPQPETSNLIRGPQAPYFEAFLGTEGPEPDANNPMQALVDEAMSTSGKSAATSEIPDPVLADVKPVTKGDVNADGMVDIITSMSGSPDGTFWLRIEDYLKIGDVKSKNGASNGEPAAARIQVYLPDDMRAGDTISGVTGTDDSGSSPAIPVQSLPQRLAVIRSLDIDAGSNPSVQEIEQMQQETEQILQSILEQVVAGGSTVELRSTSTAMDQPGMQDFPGRPTTGLSRLVTMDFSYRATDAIGQQISIDPDQLQSALDKHPTLGGTAGVSLPRDAQATPNDPHFSATGSWGETYADQWALQRVGFGPTDGGQPSAWPTEPNSLVPCTVAVIGSGVDWTHRELQGQMWMNPGEDPWNGHDDDGNGYIDDLFGWNFRENNSDVMDTGGHDTHVAGVIAARTHNDYGIAGANPAARIMALKAANYLGQADAVSISQAIRYAVNNGARVINISYGGDRSSPLEKRAIEYAASHGVLVVAAMGNQGVDAKDHAIASSPLVFTVAGSTMQDQRAGFSNWGQPVDLTAPAMDILSLRARGTDFLLYTGENPNYRSGAAIVGKQHDLYRASGTSFAAPLVSGAASLLFSRQPALSADQIRRMLLMSAEDIDIAGFDQNTGAGVLSVARSVAADPAHILLPQIVGVAVARREGKTVVELSGRMEASGEYDRWLQIAFGESPAKDSWKTISHSRNTGFEDGVLGTIPAAEFSRAGVWSIRILVQDGTESIRQARATLTTQ